MSFVLVILSAMILADVWWWFYTDRAVRRRKLPVRWRVGAGLWVVSMLLGIGLLVLARILRVRGMIMPEWAVVVVFIWHLLLLPLLLVPSLAHGLGCAVVRLVKKSKGDLLPNPERRAFLAQVLVVAPPVATLALAGKAALGRDDFVVRRAVVPLKQLPRGLDGMTIAFVSDAHVGSFMTDKKFNAIVRATNELDADLVLHGGDLINSSLADLPDGIELLRRLRGRYGVYSCQGNHDCIQSRAIFERDTKRAGVGMLLDEIETVRVRDYDLQVIAPRWARARNDAAIYEAAANVIEQRRRDLFSILVAHHPHNFDAAVAAGVPLTLAGHTHGGQLGLSPRYSVGRFMYRYHTGEYRLGDSACSVSNGIGNWFPVRVNVPAEIVQLTLTCA
jgi:hypothetical protein